jgi:hypothetical protein
VNKIKYIYFEIKYIKGAGGTEPTIVNENALMFKPYTNSLGIFRFINATERKGYVTEHRGFDEPTFSIVEQHWIDLEKFDVENRKLFSELKTHVDVVLNKLNQKIPTIDKSIIESVEYNCD